jgi:GNAT superfamily N-acetyltransferase
MTGARPAAEALAAGAAARDTGAMNIRAAAPGDEDALFGLVQALARFEKLEHTVTGSAEALAGHLFGERPSAEAILAEDGGVAIGYALFFPTYSTFLTKPGLYLEDLFVLESHRRRGVGRALLTEVERIGRTRGMGRLEWSVLDWNANAIAFYEGFGATVFAEWRICRVTFDDRG